MAKRKIEKKGKEKVGEKAVEMTAAPVENTEGGEEKKAPKIQRVRGKKYITSRSHVDRTKVYPLDEAIGLAQKTHFAKFPGSLEVNLMLRGEEGMNVDVTFPYATGRTVAVAV